MVNFITKNFIRAIFIAASLLFINWVLFTTKEPEICQSNKSISPYCNLAIVKTIQDDWGGISDIAITPDNLTLVSGSRDRGIKLWDLHSGKLKQKFPINSVEIGPIAIGPDGKTIVTGSEGKILRVWNLATGKQLAIFKGHQKLKGYQNSVSSIVISPDSQTVVSTAFSGEIKVWDVNTGRLKHTLSQPPPSFNPASTRTERLDLEISGIAITPDGQTIVSINKDWICWWDLASGKLQTTIHNTAGIEKLVSLDRDNLAIVRTNSFPHVKTLDLKTGKIHKEMRNSDRGILISTADRQYAIGLVAEDSSRASSSYQATARNLSYLTIWNLQTSQLLVNKLIRGRILAVSPDRQTIVIATDRTIEIWR
jgi:WD40 repeat protein